MTAAAGTRGLYARRHDSIEEGRAIAVSEATAERYVGSRQRKHNGDLFLTGRASFFNDLVVPNTAYAAVLRSPHAHARIRKIDTKKAAQAPGVIATLTGEEARELAGPIPFFIDPAVFGGKTTEVRLPGRRQGCHGRAAGRRLSWPDR